MSDVFVLGTLITPEQPNITNLGTLENLDVSGIATLSTVTYSTLTLNNIKIGNGIGYTNQQTNAIAIGEFAGQISQGTASIAIGQFAGQTNQNESTIVLNASGSGFNTTTNNAFYVAPIRNQTASTTTYIPLTYNTTTREIISSPQLNLSGNFAVNSNVLFVDGTNNRVGVNQSSPAYGFHSTGQTHQIGVMRIANNASITETAVRAQIYSNFSARHMTIQNNGVNRYTINNNGWLLFDTVSSSHPTFLNSIYSFTGNNIYIGSNNSNVVFRNTTSNNNVFICDNTGNMTVGVEAVFHPNLNSNQNIGYATSQQNGSNNNLWGAFRRTSPGYMQVTNASTFFDIEYLRGSSQSLFNVDSIDNVGGNLNLFLKRTNNAVAIFSVYIAKIGGAVLKDNFKISNSFISNWTTNPTLGGGSGNIIRINFNTTDTTSPQISYVAWTFEGFI